MAFAAWDCAALLEGPTGKLTVQEFLDAEWYDHWQTLPSKRDAWRTGKHADVTVEVPLALLGQMVQLDRASTISVHDKDYMDELISSIRSRGFDIPIVVAIDRNGRMVVKDGHHRIAAAQRLGLRLVPTRFENAQKLSMNGSVLVQSMLPALLLARGGSGR